jgi:POT family proton-dependent oligopeptide transporter
MNLVAPAITTKEKFPKAIPFIIGNEAAERFNFYGMKAILTIFLVSQFFNPANNPSLQTVANAKANELTHFFNTLVYFLPLLGAFIADVLWGKYKTILYLSIVYCMGSFTLAIFYDNFFVFQLGLYLIAFGSGGIKPCVSANVGDQFKNPDSPLLSKAFSWFYFSINSGSFISILLIPVLLNKYGPRVAFGIPGILMVLATIIFFTGRKFYRRVPPKPMNKENFFSINFYALKKFRQKKAGTGILDIAKEKFSTEAVNGVKAVWKIMLVFSMIPIFWALNDQNSSEWVLQATQMDLHFLGHTWLPQQIQSINPIMVLIYIPLFNYLVFPVLKKSGFKLSAYNKMATGFFLTIIASFFIYWIQTQIDNHLIPNIGWQVIAYVIITAAEVLIYQTGLEYSYTEAPPAMKSTIMSFWLLTISLGNYIVSIVNNSIANRGIFSGLIGAKFYLFFTFLISIATIIFLFITKTVKRKGLTPAKIIS